MNTTAFTPSTHAPTEEFKLASLQTSHYHRLVEQANGFCDPKCTPQATILKCGMIPFNPRQERFSVNLVAFPSAISVMSLI
jgi:hypothetical protein